VRVGEAREGVDRPDEDEGCRDGSEDEYEDRIDLEEETWSAYFLKIVQMEMEEGPLT
jgi:hypothetical protein